MIKKKICVIGLGHVGLPIAVVFATHGYSVIGVDINPKIVEMVNKGKHYTKESGVKTLLQTAIKSGSLHAQTKATKADVFLICVPTPLKADNKPELKYVRYVTKTITPNLEKGNLVIVESTVPLRTTVDIVKPILEKSGLKAGKDFYIAHCPERVFPTSILKELIENDRVIGGITKKSTNSAKELYSTFVKGNIFLTDATTAEMIKLVENTFRDVNIGLANELAKICDELKIDVWEAIEIANKHPRVNIHLPGPGVGGHCIPIDPWFIVDKTTQAKIIPLARNINDSMPQYVVRLIKNVIPIKDSKIAIFGVTYKGNVDDTRESQVTEIIKLLIKEGSDVTVYDPHVKEYEFKLSNFKSAVKDTDCIVITTDHLEFKHINPNDFKGVVRNKILVDTRNCINHKKWKDAGFNIIVLGKGIL